MKCLIIDDDRITVELLIEYLKELSETIQILDHFSTVSAAAEYIEKQGEPDLIFSDFILKEGRVINKLDQFGISCPVVFITSHFEYSIKAYRINCVGVLRKPLIKTELERVLLRQQNYSTKASEDGVRKDREFSLFIKYGDKYYITKLEEISYFFLDEGVGILVRMDGIKFPLHIPFVEIMDELVQHGFICINEGAVVNLSAIHDISFNGATPILFANPQPRKKFIVSEKFIPGFSEKLFKYYSGKLLFNKN